MRTSFLAPTLLTGLLGMACASAPAAPFDSLKNANATAYRLQNYEPQAAATPAPGAAPGAVPAIPGVPPEVMNWIQTGAQSLQQLIPPGILPGIGGANPAMPAATPEAPRFHNYRIISQTQIMDQDLREKLGNILGSASSFDNQYARCAPGVIYPEMGLSFTAGPTAQPSDVLISFSCSQVVSRSFAWPHPATGMKPDTVESLTAVVQKLWPAGT
ncbi:MAG TPA: hypothetical protein VMI54_06750 [Polyangiaceae bacterium]|nr:hypothetical protein [Polyangiaceae bacterium]